jgi:ATP-dependent DNA helicase DinG
MSLLIQEAIEREVPVIAEAGTGTGKTFGYLVPVVLSGKKTIISTGTKNLQEQIYFKDLPVLQQAVGREVDAMMMKGRTNYLCLHRYHQHFAHASLLPSQWMERKQRLEKWIQKTQFADLAELDWLTEGDNMWKAVSSTAEQCLGAQCPFFEDCFLNHLRSEAARCSIVIVNHHLFFADAKIKRSGFGEIIPRFQVAVFDEAHKVEDVATAHLGESLSTHQITEFVTDMEQGLAEQEKGLDAAPIQENTRGISASTEQIRQHFEGGPDRGRLGADDLSEIRRGPAREIQKGLLSILKHVGHQRMNHQWTRALCSRAEGLVHLLDEILQDKEEGWLRWYERRRRSVILHASPLDITERLEEILFERVHSAVFTSATLSTGGTLDYIRSRLGLEGEVLEGIYPSHFNFQAQTLLYIPKDLPSPSSTGFGRSAAKRVKDILKMTHGRALVLFTSYRNLDITHRFLQKRLPFAVYRQGEAPRSFLLDRFRRDIHSVLLATGSFWEGVDVPGEALSCLVIDKLPFDAPNDPLVAARIDLIRQRGGNPFMEYQVPSAILTLKQGLGRLIRMATDRGILAILDVRVLTSRYGSQFLKSLEEIPVTHRLEDIGRFFSNEYAVPED